MPALPIGTGRPKREIVDQAYEECGLSGFEFERTPDEMIAGLRRLNLMMKEQPWSLLGYDMPAQGEGDLADLSGLEDRFIPAVVAWLALRLAPALGKAQPPEARAARTRALQNLRAEIATAPARTMRGGIHRGAGTSINEPQWTAG